MIKEKSRTPRSLDKSTILIIILFIASSSIQILNYGSNHMDSPVRKSFQLVPTCIWLVFDQALRRRELLLV